MKNIKEILLLGASYGTNNLGVNVLTTGALESMLAGMPQARPVLLDYGKEPRHFECRIGEESRPVAVELVNLRFSKKFYLPNNVAWLVGKAAASRRLGLRGLVNNNPWLSRIRKAGLATSISGGDSFSDIYGLGRFFYVSLPQILCLEAGLPLVLLPQTLGPFKTTVAKTVARHIMRRATVVYSRDYSGMKEMAAFLGQGVDSDKVRFCYDVGFVMNPRTPEALTLSGLTPENKPSPLVGFNVSGLLWMGGYSGKNQFGLKTDYRALVERLIDYLIREKGASILLVPHVLGGRDHPESDQSVCEDLYRELSQAYKGKVYLAGGRFDQGEIKWAIGLCDFFIGARMHACIGAISQHIPAMPVAYSKKFVGVMETVGMDSYVADPRAMTLEEIMKVLERVWADRDRIRRRLEEKMPEVKARVLGLFQEIGEVIGIGKKR